MFTDWRDDTPPGSRTGTSLMRRIRKFLKDEGGTTAVEYAVMLALIILVALGAIATVGDAANFMWNDLISDGLSKT